VHLSQVRNTLVVNYEFIALVVNYEFKLFKSLQRCFYAGGSILTGRRLICEFYVYLTYRVAQVCGVRRM